MQDRRLITDEIRNMTLAAEQGKKTMGEYIFNTPKERNKRLDKKLAREAKRLGLTGCPICNK